MFLVPSRVPSNVRVSNARYDQIKVQWDPLPHQFANGRLRGYAIYYQEYYYWYLRKSVVRTSNPYANMVILRRLKAATQYQIAVAAFTSKGAGTQSYWQYITTGIFSSHKLYASKFLVIYKILTSVFAPFTKESSSFFILNLIN